MIPSRTAGPLKLALLTTGPSVGFGSVYDHLSKVEKTWVFRFGSNCHSSLCGLYGCSQRMIMRFGRAGSCWKIYHVLRRAFVAHGPPVVCLRTYVNGSWPNPCWNSKKCLFLLVWWVGVLSYMCLNQKRKRLTPRQWHELALNHEVSGMAIHLWDSGAQKRKHLVGCPTHRTFSCAPDWSDQRNMCL